jgi:hypothetical protein
MAEHSARDREEDYGAWGTKEVGGGASDVCLKGLEGEDGDC